LCVARHPTCALHAMHCPGSPARNQMCESCNHGWLASAPHQAAVIVTRGAGCCGLRAYKRAPAAPQRQWQRQQTSWAGRKEKTSTPHARWGFGAGSGKQRASRLSRGGLPATHGEAPHAPTSLNYGLWKGACDRHKASKVLMERGRWRPPQPPAGRATWIGALLLLPPPLPWPRAAVCGWAGSCVPCEAGPMNGS